MIDRASLKGYESFVGTWRIVEMAKWDRDYIDREAPGEFVFERGGRGHFHFGRIDGDLDCRMHSSGDGLRVEFTWQGFGDIDRASGRGWATLRDGEVVGHFYFHDGEDSSFRAVPKRKRAPTVRPARTRGKGGALDKRRARRA